ncbi:MAG: cytochrome c-type biogenesis protein CcmH [Armatimonadota bacterium]|nr:cytochrome c-type biogenesis protein CcmH [Armatimonadota bacterium]
MTAAMGARVRGRAGACLGRVLPLGLPVAVVAAVAVGLGVAGALTWEARPAWAAPTLDDQVYAIARELRCPVCEAQTVAESDAELARQMRAEIRARLARGQSREEIIAYFVAQFGDGVLAAPPARGLGLFLWVFPGLALAAGAAVVWAFLRAHLPPARGAPPGSAGIRRAVAHHAGDAPPGRSASEGPAGRQARE